MEILPECAFGFISQVPQQPRGDFDDRGDGGGLAGANGVDGDQDELNSYDPELMKGGWPYAERWNTDIACVMFLSWFSNPKKSVDAVPDEYASFYFGSEAATVRQLLVSLGLPFVFIRQGLEPSLGVCC